MKLIAAIVVAGFLGLSCSAQADTSGYAQRWVAHPDKSVVGFTATQEGAEFDGQFDRFSVSLVLMPTDDSLGILEINVGIQLASVNTYYKDRDDYLLQQDWFYIDMWPEAVFSSTTIRQLGDNRFVADGTLSLKGISKDIEVDLELMLDENGERGRLTGTAKLKRLDFGVGQGDWASTKWVGDEVNIKFDLRILRAFE
ncbi:MAG: YceI family protein [Gammaproteobacteria bacterium]|nr:MAG: YceI family protein [Gammaproteobacteria bacterium]